MPLSLRNGTALALPSRSWLTVSTLSAAPFCTASASSVGSSATHGAHHVAHRLSSTGVPLKSASVTVLPSGLQSPMLSSRFSPPAGGRRSEEHTSELQSLMRISYAVFCLKKKNK